MTEAKQLSNSLTSLFCLNPRCGARQPVLYSSGRMRTSEPAERTDVGSDHMGFNADFTRCPPTTLAPGQEATWTYWWDSRLQAGNWHRMCGSPDNQNPPSSSVQIVAEWQVWNDQSNLLELWVTWRNNGSDQVEFWPTIAMVPSAD